MIAPCLLCDIAHGNYRSAVVHWERLLDANASAEKVQTAEDHMYSCLNEANWTEAQHDMGKHRSLAMQERLA